MGLAVSLADREAFAAKSTLVLDTSHWSDPLIPLRALRPLASSFVFPFIRCRFFGQVELGIEQLACEVLLVHLDRVVILLEVPDSTQGKGVRLPFSPFV